MEEELQYIDEYEKKRKRIRKRRKMQEANEEVEEIYKKEQNKLRQESASLPSASRVITLDQMQSDQSIFQVCIIDNNIYTINLHIIHLISSIFIDKYHNYQLQ